MAAEPDLAASSPTMMSARPGSTQASEMLDRYFTLEDPTRLEPAHRELQVEAVLSSGLRLRGYIDRLDVSAAGESGSSTTRREPRRVRSSRRGHCSRCGSTHSCSGARAARCPRLLQLIYLGNGEIVRYAPDEADLLATERKIEALWRAIERAREAGDWRPRPGSSATGARTSRSARSSAALRRHCLPSPTSPVHRRRVTRR